MLLVGPAVLLLAWRFAAPRTRRYAAAVVGTVLGLMLAGYVLMAAIRNELFPGAGHVSLVEAVQFQLYGRDSGGSVFDAASLNHTTFQQWWVLDPVLLTAAVPAAVAGLAVRRLQPIATAVVLLAAVLLRDGYLPAPIVIGALPLIALLVAGVPDAALRWARARARRQSGRKVRSALLVGVLAATAVLGVSAGTTWAPVLRYLLVADTDAPLRQAQEWITNSVPRDDRLIVDDALWVDLVSEGRDRRDVVWFYKVDTDAEVQGWAPRGWRDYDWVVSSPSLRSGTPSTGVLADAVSALGSASRVRQLGRPGRAAPRRSVRGDVGGGPCERVGRRAGGGPAGRIRRLGADPPAVGSRRRTAARHARDARRSRTGAAERPSPRCPVRTPPAVPAASCT